MTGDTMSVWDTHTQSRQAQVARALCHYNGLSSLSLLMPFICHGDTLLRSHRAIHKAWGDQLKNDDTSCCTGDKFGWWEGNLIQRNCSVCQVALSVLRIMQRLLHLESTVLSTSFQYLLMQSLKSPRTQATAPSFRKSSPPSLMSSSATADVI